MRKSVSMARRRAIPAAVASMAAAVLLLPAAGCAGQLTHNCPPHQHWKVAGGVGRCVHD